MIERNVYLNQLISKKNNGLIKVITGIRRCGKSYLLDPIFKNHLLDNGIDESHIIKVELDTPNCQKYYNDSSLFFDFLSLQIKDDKNYYFILDEIQLVNGFELVLNGLLYKKNVDIYVTGSNSKFLSSDIITEFRGRADQIHVMPLSFNEFISVSNKDKFDAWNEYSTFGGMPVVLTMKTDIEKINYLKDLYDYTYFKDIVERNKIQRLDVIDSITNILSSSIGSLTNAKRIYDTFKSKGEKELSINTISSYLKAIENSFIVNKSLRYDIKGRKYIETPSKYYFIDLGLRNAKLNFRQQEETHLMENAIYNELLHRGYSVDVGIVDIRTSSERLQTEVDFVCNLGYQRYYIQSAYSIESAQKLIQESRPLNEIHDSFKKIIIVKDYIKSYKTEEGILIINLFDFLLDINSLEKN